MPESPAFESRNKDKNLRGHRHLPVTRRLWWWWLYTGCWAWMTCFYQYRAWGRRNVPREGPVILASNHQSYFDPIIMGLGTPPMPAFAIARSTLFKHPVFTWLIESLNAIPVRQGESDLVAMRRSIDVLKRGHRLMIFPEGSRTEDGEMHEFKEGTMLLIRRAKVPVVPMAMEGAFGVWPIHRGRPRATGRIGVIYGEPIPAETMLALPTAEALALLRDRIEALRGPLRERLATAGRWGGEMAGDDGED
jgi:1-acyl-sn-glycerol-3-phosphate acyltransferase